MNKLVVALVLLGCLVGLLVLFAVWRYLATMYASMKTVKTLRKRIEPVITDLRASRQPQTAAIEALAADATTRNLLYSALRKLGRTDLFPAQYHTLGAIGESDLVRWLLHPNELGSKPDEIEAVTTIERSDNGKTYRFVVFRFRTQPPHWAAEQGWLAGIAGPYWDGEDPDGSPGRVFSKFEQFDSKSPEQHFEDIQKFLDRR